MKIRISLVVFWILSLNANSLIAQDEMQTDTFSFLFEGKRLNGILDIPTHQSPRGIIVIIHGDGKTNVVAGRWYYDIRTHFANLGFSCCVWDKAGCGKSEGEYTQQGVHISAKEASCAIDELKHRNIAGSNKIGLWGISRAGWICPLIIKEYRDIAFWISVSGTDDKENFAYQLETNLRIEGKSEFDINRLVNAWYKGNEIYRKGGYASEYFKATKSLREDSICQKLWGYSNDKIDTTDFAKYQLIFINENHQFDKETGLMVYVPDFDILLKSIQCPVLAIFGEKDAHVDWTKTKALYSKTIPNLTIKTLPYCNHGIQKCKNGGLSEWNRNNNIWQPCDGYYDAMITWLTEIKNKK